MSAGKIMELSNISLTHHYIDSGDCRIHVVEAGQGPVVVLCHGFPELWLSWRNQIPALVKAGYRVLAFDMRGHGESGAPDNVTAYSVLHTVGDVIAVLDSQEIKDAFIVGHDAGTTTAFHACLMRPDRFKGVVALSVPYVPRGPMSLMAGLRHAFPAEFYIHYFQESGVAENEFEKDVANTIRKMVFGNSAEFCRAMFAYGGALLPNLPDVPDSMAFLPEEIFDFYVKEYERTGFRGALNGYRVLELNWQLTAPWQGVSLPCPASYIGGKRDNVLDLPGIKEFAQAMDRAVFVEGAGHWVQAEAADSVNTEIIQSLDDWSA